MIEVTQLLCPEHLLEGTHHLIPKGPMDARFHVCRDCGKTEKQLREEAQHD